MYKNIGCTCVLQETNLIFVFLRVYLYKYLLKFGINYSLIIAWCLATQEQTPVKTNELTEKKCSLNVSKN